MTWFISCDDCHKNFGVCDGWGTDVDVRLCLKCAKRKGMLPVTHLKGK